ncbi:MAG: AmmeMemoRadiSam system radical SAM enzyme [Butyrivibrio sp.]|nr:AmmeMemoRadiSam system radical SAM enzyme [Butyrivibrio sp.]MBR1640815.1 AmmeMemoRadiSam system radical SAM enzyme [Butyrivibrio sp.]
MPKCNVCHNGCYLNEGDIGLCMARTCRDGKVVAKNYGQITSIALDTIEKKPLNLFYPGSMVVSVGSYGCNLRCPFCQNHEISYDFDREYPYGFREISPVELADIALQYKDEGNIGIAFTYNEPLVGYEYVIDAAREVHERGMKTVLVSNGNVSREVAEEVIPHIDAMNIDLKGFTDAYYRDALKGDREMVMDFIEMAAGKSHVEVTTLVVPGYNDTEAEIKELSKWLSFLDGGRGKESIALHLSRYFPRFKMDVPATDVGLIYHLRDVAREELDNVFTGNC